VTEPTRGSEPALIERVHRCLDRRSRAKFWGDAIAAERPAGSTLKTGIPSSLGVRIVKVQDARSRR
jgi:hypothetical protein